MIKQSKYDYDAIVIGAGISGLVCGCYLAKAGLKTLIIEKNSQAGGYCTTFTRKGFRFDACVHSLSSLRKNGKFFRILDELKVIQLLDIKRSDPSDIVITKDTQVSFFNNYDKTISGFQKIFPLESAKIDEFFSYVKFTPVNELSSIRSLTFAKLLNCYFDNSKIRNIFSTIIFGLTGSPAHRISALVAILVIREFILDGGYYLSGGINKLPEALINRHREYGGDCLFSSKVEKIILDCNKVAGVLLEDKSEIKSRIVIAACDARYTFKNLIDANNNLLTRNRIHSFSDSLSAFLVYLGIDGDLKNTINFSSTVWLMNSDSDEEIYRKTLAYENVHLAITSPSEKERSSLAKKTLCLTTNTVYNSFEFWNKNRGIFKDRLMKMVKSVIPELSNNINVSIDATPLTLQRWTGNHNGAAYGWESTPKQFGDPDISQRTVFDNLYLTGHWSNFSSGITSVADCGFETARMILNKERSA